jgi:hypothetical protein
MQQERKDIAIQSSQMPSAGGEIASADSKAVDRESKSSEPSWVQWMKLSEAPLVFWNAPGEDIYTESDGEPI